MAWLERLEKYDKRCSSLVMESWNIIPSNIYDLILGGEDDTQNYEFIITDNINLYYLLDNIDLSFVNSESRCCNFHVLDLLRFDYRGQNIETPEYGYELMVEK